MTDESAQVMDNITAIGSPYEPGKGPSPYHCVSIIGQVEGHMLLPPQNKTTKYEHVIPQLIAIEESPQIKGFLLLMNTAGGDVEAGLAIAELISSMSKPSVAIVLGGGHSIGVPLAISARRSFITPTATMTVHPIRMNGTIIGVPQSYEYFDKMQQRLIRFIVSHSHITEEKLNQIMLHTGDLAGDIGTVLIGEEAVECGLIDQVGGLNDAMRALREMEEPCGG